MKMTQKPDTIQPQDLPRRPVVRTITVDESGLEKIRPEWLLEKTSQVSNEELRKIVLPS